LLQGLDIRLLGSHPCNGDRRRGSAFVRENRALDGRPPFATRPDILAQDTLLAHSELRHRASKGSIPDARAGADAVQVQGIEADAQQGGPDLGREVLCLMMLGDGPANLPVPMPGAPNVNNGLADDLARVLQNRSETRGGRSRSWPSGVPLCSTNECLV
jgi:hypothetical protein